MSRSLVKRYAAVLPLALTLMIPLTARAEDWRQLKFDCRHSGDVPERSVTTPLGLVGAVPLTDAVFTSPVLAGGKVYVLDGAGVMFCIDAETLEVAWKRPTGGGAANCNNLASPAVVDGYLHFGTTADGYYVLEADTGKVVRHIECGEPIFSAPVVSGDRVYFATLGSRVYALKPDGTICWQWDYVKEQLGFDGDRWSGQDWLEHKGKRVTWRDQFCCSRDIAAFDKTIVLPAGGLTVWLRDGGDRAEVRGLGQVPSYKGGETPGTFGISIGPDGSLYWQWHRRDNTGRVEVIRLGDDGKFKAAEVPGTLVRNDLPGSMGVSAVSIRGDDVVRCRPEEGFGCCVHTPGQEEPRRLGGFPSISSPILLRDQAVYGGLDGRLYVVPLSSEGGPWSFATAFGKAITAPAAVCDGRIYFGCEDGYLYVLGPDGDAPLPTKDLELWKIRTPLTGRMADASFNWYSNYANVRNTNSNRGQARPPMKLEWIRRVNGTYKHIPVCGGGRMYTHTAEGLLFAVEQETGRLLWRRYWPGVHVSYTSPIYHEEKLLVPQAGMERSRMRCLDAATGELLWEAPFTGSPSWSRQQPPVIYNNLAIYMFSTGKYAAKGTGIFVFGRLPEDTPTDEEEVVSWLYTHDNARYPESHKPLVRAWDLDSGKVAWQQDFSHLGSGGDDAGLAVMDGTLYYSCFFGYKAQRRGKPGPSGVTAAMDPATGKVLWKTTDYSVTAGCTISAADGRLYLGGYNAPDSADGPRHVWCLDAKDGSLVWESEPLVKAINVATVGSDFIFAFAYGGNAYVIDRATGKIRHHFNHGYACSRFTLSEPYLVGPNMDLIDVSEGSKLVSTGPPIDVRDCVGGSVSNGRVYYTTQASGLQACQSFTGTPARE